MSPDPDGPSGTGMASSFGWAIGGAVGGTAGTILFGLVMWVVDPEVFSTAIPALYGIEARGTVGWLLHVVHGVVLGLVFGFLVTRRPVLGVIETDVETDALSRTGTGARVVAAGFAYGLAVWAVLPVAVQPVWAGAVGGDASAFPAVALESMGGHLLFGIVLGAVFAAIVDVSDRSTPDPLKEGERATMEGNR